MLYGEGSHGPSLLVAYGSEVLKPRALRGKASVQWSSALFAAP